MVADEEDGEDEYVYMIRAALLKLPHRQGTIPMVYSYIEVRVAGVRSSTRYPQSGRPHHKMSIHVNALSSVSSYFFQNTRHRLHLYKSPNTGV